MESGGVGRDGYISQDPRCLGLARDGIVVERRISQMRISPSTPC